MAILVSQLNDSVAIRSKLDAGFLKGGSDLLGIHAKGGQLWAQC